MSEGDGMILVFADNDRTFQIITWFNYSKDGGVRILPAGGGGERVLLQKRTRTQHRLVQVGLHIVHWSKQMKEKTYLGGIQMAMICLVCSL